MFAKEYTIRLIYRFRQRNGWIFGGIFGKKEKGSTNKKGRFTRKKSGEIRTVSRTEQKSPVSASKNRTQKIVKREDHPFLNAQR